MLYTLIIGKVTKSSTSYELKGTDSKVVYVSCAVFAVVSLAMDGNEDGMKGYDELGTFFILIYGGLFVSCLLSCIGTASNEFNLIRIQTYC